MPDWTLIIRMHLKQFCRDTTLRMILYMYTGIPQLFPEAQLVWFLRLGLCYWYHMLHSIHLVIMTCTKTTLFRWRNAWYADGTAYNFPREAMFLGLDVSWSTKWYTTNSFALEVVPPKLIGLPFVPCFQCLPNIHITCTTYTHTHPLLTSIPDSCSKKGAHSWRPGVWVAMSPAQELSLTEWTLFCTTLGAHHEEIGILTIEKNPVALANDTRTHVVKPFISLKVDVV